MARPAQIDPANAKRIVDAAREVIAEHGSRAATFENIAELAGVSRGLVHYYFKRKDALLCEVARSSCEMYREIVSAAFAQAESVDELLDHLLDILRASIEADPAFYGLMFELMLMARHNDEVATEIRAMAGEWTTRLGGELSSAAERGLVRPLDDPEGVAKMCLAITDGLSLHAMVGVDVAPGIEATRQLLRGLFDPAARTAPAPSA